MSDSATLQKVVTEIIIDKGWDKEFFKKGVIETAKNLILMGFSIEQIAQATKLSMEQIENLKQNL